MPPTRIARALYHAIAIFISSPGSADDDRALRIAYPPNHRLDFHRVNLLRKVVADEQRLQAMGGAVGVKARDDLCGLVVERDDKAF